MKEKVSVSNCSQTLVKRYECILKFIATKMKCQPNWEKKYYETNKQLQKCHSIDDLKEYFKIKFDIYIPFLKSIWSHKFYGSASPLNLPSSCLTDPVTV